MNYNQNQKQQVLPRFYPANTSLNKNADGLICSINTTTNDIIKSRSETRLEFYRNQKQGASANSFPTQQSTFGGVQQTAFP